MKPNRLKGGLYLSVASLTFMTSGYLTNIFLGRKLGPEFYGIYGVLTSFVTAINIMQLSGISQAVSKFISENRHNADSILKTAIKLQLWLSGILNLLIFLLAPLVANVFHDVRMTGYIRAASFILPVYGLYTLYIGYYNGKHNFKRQAFINIIYSLAKITLIISLAIVFSLYGVIIGFIASPVVALVFGFHRPKASIKFPGSKLIIFALPLIGFAILVTLQLSIDLFSLKALAHDARLAGYYTAAQNIALIPYLGLSAFGQILLPSIARFLGAGKKSEASLMIGRSFRYLLLLLLPIAAAIGATAPALIHLLFGKKYLSAASPLRILLAGYVLLTIFSMLANVLNGAGRAKTSMIIAASGVATAFIGCLILIPRYGSDGAALGTLSGATVSAVISLTATYRLFRFDVPYFSLVKIVFSSAVVLIGGLLFPAPIVLLPLVYILLGVIYVFILHRMGEVTLEDRAHIKNLLPAWLPFARLL